MAQALVEHLRFVSAQYPAELMAIYLSDKDGYHLACAGRTDIVTPAHASTLAVTFALTAQQTAKLGLGDCTHVLNELLFRTPSAAAAPGSTAEPSAPTPAAQGADQPYTVLQLSVGPLVILTLSAPHVAVARVRHLLVETQTLEAAQVVVSGMKSLRAQ
ncbi:hypothetical protein CXG81DRAFT_24400 [Caulochytrium protostelioides]|uniref:Roadblock/LAMTOR2 domain-containing protein n=1 Tax=Caulochytrium protostelioides TaxID=1555241 RepID=A0A4P9XC53_9FUNG|nr:hypothetical protein CXG81DRAFT_24400 [Caulochytrium protostelioides]|eukprot:RKP02995.1 hypothetical protein CXG81DRAFT_24400 [Caulochytrium protostelioides]